MRVLSLTIGFLALIGVKLTLADVAVNPLQDGRRKLKHEDWAPIHYQAYDTKGYYQTPETVWELLKKLEKIYEPFPDEETNGRKQRVNNLLEVAIMDPNRCSREYMHDFYKLIKYNSVYSRTMMPYLTFHFINFLSMCEEETLHHNIPLMKQKYRDDIKDLVRLIATTEIDGFAPGYESIDNIKQHYAHVIRGILFYLEEKSGMKLEEIFASRMSNEQNFKELFSRHVIDMCRVWKEATDPADALINYDVHLNLDNDERRWLTYGRLCAFILKEKDTLYLKMSSRFRTTSKDKERKGTPFGFRKRLSKLSMMKP